jgi:hypothetical protein
MMVMVRNNNKRDFGEKTDKFHPVSEQVDENQAAERRRRRIIMIGTRHEKLLFSLLLLLFPKSVWSASMKEKAG